MSSFPEKTGFPWTSLSSTAVFRRSGAHYQTETLRPIVCLAYVVPFLLTYEIGVIVFDHQSIRSGLDIWIGNILGVIGAGELLLLPLMTIFLLFGMHHYSNDRWSFRPTVLAGMLVESLALALIVWLAARAQHLFFLQSFIHSPVYVQLPGIGGSTGVESWWISFVSFCGAGLYEELLFRLLLVPTVIFLLMKTGLRPFSATFISVITISVLFALAHYEMLNPAGTPFELPGFVIRFVASIFFCLVFLFRGFGVAVGTHVAYDVLTRL